MDVKIEDIVSTKYPLPSRAQPFLFLLDASKSMPREACKTTYEYPMPVSRDKKTEPVFNRSQRPVIPVFLANNKHPSWHHVFRRKTHVVTDRLIPARELRLEKILGKIGVPLEELDKHGKATPLPKTINIDKELEGTITNKLGVKPIL